MTSALDPILIGDPASAPSVRPRRHLRRVDRTRRGSPAVPVLVGAGMVIAALFAIAIMHALMISGQVSLDAMQRDVASETEDVAALRLRVAQLEAPDRVLAVAEERLGMVVPGEVGYLAPLGVDVGAEPTRVAAATTIPPVAEDGDGATIADGATGDAGTGDVSDTTADAEGDDGTDETGASTAAGTESEVAPDADAEIEAGPDTQIDAGSDGEIDGFGSEPVADGTGGGR